MPEFVDIQETRVVVVPDDAPPDAILEADAAVIGGGLGGVAAALALCRAGKTVVLSEETDWLGGQLTAQGVSAPDEHQFIETFGATTAYHDLRHRIRQYYRRHTGLTAEVAAHTNLNPGDGWVSRLCFEPRVGVAVIQELLAPYRDAGRLILRLRHRAVAAEVRQDRILSVRLQDLDALPITPGSGVEVRAAYFLDATELGDLLPLAGVEYVSGAEARSDTGEPHALDAPATERAQSFTYPFALELCPGERHVIPPVEEYTFFRDAQPYTLRHRYYTPDRWLTYRMFTPGEGAVLPFWTYRRLINAANFQDSRYPRDIAMINWPGNDFRWGTLIDRPAAETVATLRRAQALSLGFCHWLQTEALRDEGGYGYPEFRLRPDVMGTENGLSKHPYIRESRRIRARKTVVEQEIAAHCLPDRRRARLFLDSVGVGLYAIDIHPGEQEEKIPPQQALPFQIPLGALLPIRVRNLLPACKNIGTTHITNGAYRLHPVEWNIGEAAGTLAAFCLDEGISPAQVWEQPFRRRCQQRLLGQGVPLFWWTDVPPAHAAFTAAHLLAVEDIWPEPIDRLEFLPEEPLTAAELDALAARRHPSPLAPNASRAAVAQAILDRRVER
ncbi:MAG: FAD-dependent oxidoreductase [Armatimonadetes bacterium]|nr:FAD-dependent oxidoreductase [Armatimonadota bacterium]